MDFLYDPADPLTVYAASELSGILRSTDGGLTWSDFSDGIFYPVMYSLAVTADAHGPRLVTGSYGSGASWRRILGPGEIFSDDFEIGSSGRWSSASQ